MSGDEGDFWRDVNAARQQKRASNRDNSADMLRAAGVKFEERNIGAHLIVQAPAETIDFWPGTGLWIVRGSTKRSYGVRNLIAKATGSAQLAAPSPSRGCRA